MLSTSQHNYLPHQLLSVSLILQPQIVHHPKIYNTEKQQNIMFEPCFGNMGLTANPRCIFCLQKDKNLTSTKLKAFADDKFIVAIMMISVFDRVENIVEKGENAGYQHFLLFPQCFQKVPYIGSLKL